MLANTSKIVVCGDYGVGKTTFVKLFLGGEIVGGYKPTIGVDIGRKIFYVDDTQIIFQIWDLSGQKSFHSIRKQFYSRTNGAILIFDVSRRETYQNITRWTRELLEQTGKIPIVLVANKIDLRDESTEVVTTEEGEHLSRVISNQTGITTPFVEASAIRQEKNLEPFMLLGKTILEHS
ncbi:MAG: GTP-binding protein [Candidatus Thorarchaeota archaeon]